MAGFDPLDVLAAARYPQGARGRQMALRISLPFRYMTR